MKTLQRISIVFILSFALITLIGETRALASQSGQAISVPLKSLAVSTDEVREQWGIFPEFALYRYDVTSELKGSCFIDCVKIIWTRSSSITSETLSLTMLRARNSENAIKSVQNLWQMYLAMGEGFSPSKELAEGNSFWQGKMLYQNGKHQYLSVRTQGPITIIVVFDFRILQFIPEFDGSLYSDLVEELSNIQQQKLLEAGFEP